MPFDSAKFRELFPEFADTTVYPDAMLAGYYLSAECIMGERWAGCECGERALYLLTAHFAAIRTLVGSGEAIAVGPVTSSTVGGVSVTVSAPAIRSAWQAWLYQTPYGIELWALLSALTAGGTYVGGSLERRGFRKFGGGFRG